MTEIGIGPEKRGGKQIDTYQKNRQLLMFNLELTAYCDVLKLQQELVHARQSGSGRTDYLLITEHRSVYTIGTNGHEENLHAGKQEIDLIRVSRGGDITWHGPGQLVLYPILGLDKLRLGVRDYVFRLEEVMLATVRALGVEARRNPRNAGIWTDNAKLGSIGIAVKRGITMHGLALNLNPDLTPFQRIHPCGMKGIKMTSVEEELKKNNNGKDPLVTDLMERARLLLVENFATVFGMEDRYSNEVLFPGLSVSSVKEQLNRKQLWHKPAWLRRPLPEGKRYQRVRDLISREKLHTVCQDAACPNMWECFSRGTATFLLLGPRCTRSCRFCNIATGPVLPVDPDEPARISAAVVPLKLSYLVLTSVTRDDLEDGGAEQFVATMQSIRNRGNPETKMELLIPDFQGKQSSLETVLNARPDVLSHNIETVPSLYAELRPQGEYERSLEIFRISRRISSIPVKSGLMLGLGETYPELERTMEDLLDAGCSILTLGQYLQPAPARLPVQRYYTPEEFRDLELYARELGFKEVAAAPLIRSSYKAELLVSE